MRGAWWAAAGIAIGAPVLFVCSSVASREALARACLERRDAERCRRLGDLVERGRIRPAFPEEAGLYFSVACQGGVSRACPRAERYVPRYGEYETLEIDVGCMLRRNAFACEEVADAVRAEHDERGGDGSDLAGSRAERALDLYVAGCGTGDAPSCLGASRLYRGGAAGPRDRTRAAAATAKACSLGLAAACEQQGDSAGAAEGIALYRQACDLPRSSPHACLKLARAVESAGRPSAEVVAAYRRACDRLSLEACRWLQDAARLDPESHVSPTVAP